MSAPPLTPAELALARIAARRVADALVETIASEPMGAPAGWLYVAFAMKGWQRATFDRFMNGLVEVGRLRRDGDLYFVEKPMIAEAPR